MKTLFCVVILVLIAVITSQIYSKRDGCRATALLLCNNGNSGMNNGGMYPGMNNGGMYPGMNNGGMYPGMNNGGMYPGGNYPGMGIGGGRDFLACCLAMCGDDCID
ncbi:hypothetical protein LOTGIDRAFT_238110 [Lottia gigantea]|uniref:Uncharacterized protein n=1 Tax=Lottia gigantea TaxID=225164 RepID=V4B852_LOTGI|nr:hypothetical protein LOTGIDRAFT_238110 [Lottia gigantea]ESP01857.1 hypothetical protein LOTGIDRAFT_238110 [Lottia gigantea]